MPPLILVGYATRKGSTRDVAAAIADSLTAQGIVTHLRAVRDLADLDAYDGVVLGAALYTGRLHRDARSFLHAHATTLARKPLAVFAMGPRTLAAADVASSRKQLETALAKEPALRPFATAVFGGVLDPSQHRFPFSRMPASDARDWDTIRAWANETAERFADDEPTVEAL
jgi:menaquinone-dependent protoporphyrinogen oxidase